MFVVCQSVLWGSVACYDDDNDDDEDEDDCLLDKNVRCRDVTHHVCLVLGHGLGQTSSSMGGLTITPDISTYCDTNPVS